MDYYAFTDYGLLLDDNAIKTIAFQVFDEYEDEDADWGYELYEKGICEYISSFTGEARNLTDDGTYDWGCCSDSYHDDTICYIPISNYPTPFKKAYRDMEEVIDEFKNTIGKYLTNDFDYRNNIRYICGTYYG